MSTITTPDLEACPRCDTPIQRGLLVCPRCGLRLATVAAAATGGAASTNPDADALAGPQGYEYVQADESTEVGGVEEAEEAGGTDEMGRTEEPADEGGAVFITGESVPLNAGETDTGALAGRSTRAGDDPVFASLPDAEDDVPTDTVSFAAPPTRYEAPEAPEASDAPDAPAMPGALDAPYAQDFAPDAHAADTTPGDAQEGSYEATPEAGPVEAPPEVVQDLASDIARDAERAPEIVGAPVAMSIPTGPLATVEVEDQQRSRNQLLAAGVAALAVLVLCVAVILAASGGGGGNVTPTAEAERSPTMPVVAIATIATSTPDTTSPNPTTDAIPIETSTATTGPVIVPTDTVLALPTDTVLPAPTDTSVPLPTDTSVPVPTDTVAPPPTDTPVPAPTDTVAPLPADTVAPAPTNTQVTRPTSTRAPIPTNTLVRPQPTATRPAPPQPTTPTSRGIGDLVTGFNGWTVLPMRTQLRNQLPSPDPQVFYRPSGVYWLVRVDVRNTLSEPRSFGGTMDFVMRDTNGNLYAELSDHGKEPGVREVARREGLGYLDLVLNQGEAAATLLIYDIPRGVQPAQLVGRIRQGNAVLRDGQVVWNLQR